MAAPPEGIADRVPTGPTRESKNLFYSQSGSFASFERELLSFFQLEKKMDVERRS